MGVDDEGFEPALAQCIFRLLAGVDSHCAFVEVGLANCTVVDGLTFFVGVAVVGVACGFARTVGLYMWQVVDSIVFSPPVNVPSCLLLPCLSLFVGFVMGRR